MQVVHQWQSMLVHIRALEHEFHRSPNSVGLLAVSKRQPLDKILALIEAGQKDFGENYLSEALLKVSALKEKDVVWHFIGRLQSRKIPEIALNFDWVHSVSRIKEIKLLNQHRLENAPPLNICLQCNLEGTENKSGAAPAELEALAATVQQQPKLRLRGLMTFPEPHDTFEAQRKPFKELREAASKLLQKGYDVSTLSMGTSHDYKAAIAEGATLIRLGETIFGPREGEDA